MSQKTFSKTLRWCEPRITSHGPAHAYPVPVQFLLDERVHQAKGGTTAFRVFVALCQLANLYTGLVGHFENKTKIYQTPSLDTIGKIAGLSAKSKSRVSNAIKLLGKLGWCHSTYRNKQTLIIHLRFPEADLNVLNADGEFSYKNKTLAEDEIQARKEAIDARFAKHDKYAVKPEDAILVMTDEECAAEEAKTAAAIAEMRKQDSAGKSTRAH